MTINKANRKTLLLGFAAVLLVFVTLYDYTVGIGEKSLSTGSVERKISGTSYHREKTASLSGEIAELRFFLTHAPEIRARYQKIAAPYAESVATFATLYPKGDDPVAVAKQYLDRLLVAPIKLGDVLISSEPNSDQGAVMLIATLNFASNDSLAFEKTLLALGDATNGTVWKELAITSNPDQRELKASGQLALLMVEQVE